ncbi:alpha-amylase family protein [Agromyces rhizosphaerae]|uniref:alpha-amylase family protein n=1 Tax=Agromyces rhizosphaerae TaxID=88374 RepID=UPI002490442F|nr:alpha-amylase family protein [Agromyces rhizosphaerae]
MTSTPDVHPSVRLARELGVWVHPDLVVQSPRPRRKIHLDFHNTPHVGEVGAGFEPEEFARRLTDAGVDSIVVFAKDMHGYFYYPSQHGPVHPGLGSRDLLGEQVAACRSVGIAVYAYYCTTWDNFLAEHRPEWLCFTRERRTYLPGFDETPAWTALCLANDDFVQLMLDHTTEILERYRPDGIWYDMPMTNLDGECFCARCLEALRAEGRDPLDIETQRDRAEMLLTRWLETSRRHIESIQPGCGVEQNNQTRLGLGRRATWLENVEIEALPTGGWGYGYFPLSARLVRGVGLPHCGQTGRFHRAWADFGGLKSEAQLRLETAAIAALGAEVAIGDQPGPSGRLDPAVYDTIGAAFGALADIDDVLAGAVGVAEAAVLVEGLSLSDLARAESHGGERLPTSALGAAKLLTEAHVQFDVIEAGTVPFERYPLLVVAEGATLSDATIAAVSRYLDGGGRVLHSMFPDEDASRYPWLVDLGLERAEPSPYEPAYVMFEGDEGERTTGFEFALYDGAARWHGAWNAEVIATLGEPAFQRAPDHYTSHAQSPVATRTGLPLAVHRDRVAAVAFPVATSYHRHGYHVYRRLFDVVLERLAPEPLLRTQAGPTLELTATVQADPVGAGARLNVHALNFAGAVRRSPQHLEYHDVVVPRSAVVLSLRCAVDPARVRAVRARVDLAWVRVDGRIQVELSEVEIDEVVSFEFPGSSRSAAGAGDRPAVPSQASQVPA